MVRIRYSSGAVTELPAGQFAEICDLDGKVAVLIYQDTSGLIHTVRATDTEAVTYARMFNIQFVPLVPVNLHA